MGQVNNRKLVSDFCELIGKDELLVQGAGGNVSWKEDNILWVKASGTWLENVNTEDIFVPVCLNTINSEIKKNNYDFKPRPINESSLKPSIETILHALMKEKYVVHLHAVDIISDLIKDNCLDILNEKMPKNLLWKLIDYYTPGPDLARSIKKIIDLNPKTKILFLRNHGLVISSDCIDNLKESLYYITKIFKKNKNLFKIKKNHIKAKVIKNNIEYKLIRNQNIRELSFSDNLIKMIKQNWAICPDHIVFLGREPFIYDSLENFQASKKNMNDLIFIKNYGAYCTPNFNNAKIIQLKCYFNIISRINSSDKIRLLSKKEISKLLNWDAEKYRLSLMK